MIKSHLGKQRVLLSSYQLVTTNNCNIFSYNNNQMFEFLKTKTVTNLSSSYLTLTKCAQCAFFLLQLLNFHLTFQTSIDALSIKLPLWFPYFLLIDSSAKVVVDPNSLTLSFHSLRRSNSVIMLEFHTAHNVTLTLLLPRTVLT